MKLSKISLIPLLFILSSAVLGVVADEVPVPNEFHGNVSINGEDANDRTVRVLLNGKLEKSFETDSSGFEVLVQGDTDEEVTFEVEDYKGDFVSNDQSWEIGEFGEIQDIQLDFEVKNPDPTVSASVSDKGESFAVVETSFNFADENSDVYVEYNGSVTVDKETSGEDVVFNLTGLDYDSRYEYQVFLSNGTDEFNNSVDSFETDNLDSLTVQGSTNLNSSERVVASIGVETVYNESLDSNGDFFFTESHNDTYNSSEVAINILNQTKRFNYSAGETLKPNFTFKNRETDTENDETENETDNTSTKDEPGTLESEVMSDDEEDTGSDTVTSDSNTDNETDDSRNSSLDSSETSNEEEDSTEQSLTGQFISSQTNNTSLFLVLLISVLGGYLVLEFI